MPYKWVDPELFWVFSGTSVYHTYKNDTSVYHTYKNDEEGQRMDYHYTTDPDAMFDSDSHMFDIRDLPGWSEADDKRYGLVHRREIIRKAINNGLITSPEE